MNIAIMGHGVVGSGVAEIIHMHGENFAKKTKQESIDIKYILDLRTFPDSPYSDRFTTDFGKIVNDDSVKVVVETMGGLVPAFDYVKSCLEAGKHVVTSNKELVAAKGLELLRIAEEKGVNFLFEASVGGGIPIIRPINQCLSANEIDEIAGILNGTTNFILTKMFKEKMSFNDALKLAQDLGYAERNPAADVEGFDACRKICILASLSFGKHVYPEQVFTQGITQITEYDVEYAAVWGGVIKLIGRAKRMENGQISAMVTPAFIKNGSQLASVDDVFNAILVKGDAIGDVVFYGRGAGKLPTASAVVADVLDCINHMNKKKIFGWDAGYDGYVVDCLETETSFYVRAHAKGLSVSQASAAIENAFGKVRFLKKEGMPCGEIAFVTPVMAEGEINRILSEISEIEIVNKIHITDY
ncbi:MAG: homoserine dehydrogenase [Clostridia bacterium]|nr:homoserine dehydrogenase [Clostridia bacterium]